jgi:hypothetical protein
VPPDEPVHGRLPQLDEVEERRRCYREALVRHLYLDTAEHIAKLEVDNGWKTAEGNPTAKRQRYEDRASIQASAVNDGMDGSELEALMRGATFPVFTFCDLLDYKAPPPVPCDDLAAHPVVVDKARPDAFYQALARLDLVLADPGRQQELFGWTTPDPATAPADSARASAQLRDFEQSKTAYWNGVCHSALEHLEILKETADFKACDLIRLLYLAGDVPQHLRDHQAPWREPARLGRDVNFSAEVEAHIRKALLEFKYWVDDPFYADGSFNAADRELLIRARRRADAGAEQPPLSQDVIDARVNAAIDEDDVPKEMTTWSENHQMLFASAEYLAGQWMPDDVFRAGLPLRGEGPQRSRPGDTIGAQRMLCAKPRILRWLADRMRLGFSEWNALPYYEEDIAPLLNLVDFCLDEEIRERAAVVLDLLLFDLARFTLNGRFGPAAGRAYDDQKMCGYKQGIGDLVEVVFGTRGGVIVWSGATSAGAFSSSRRYVVPEVLIRIGQDRPRGVVDRSRVSLRFDEAAPYGARFDTLDDAMFWWSRSAYVTKEVVGCSRRIAAEHHLGSSDPFKLLLPMFSKIVDAEKLGQKQTVLAFPPAAFFMDRPSASGVADRLSPLTEGSALTRANLYTYRNRDAMLSSVQNFRRGQFNAQSHVCQATLSPAATVWTTHPAVGAEISLFLAGLLGGFLAYGPAGAVIGGVIGGIGGAVTGGEAEVIAADDLKGDGPNWWTGSASLPRVVQRDGAAIIAYQPAEVLRHLLGDDTHAWFPKRAFDDGSVSQGRSADCNVPSATWTFGRLGDGYVALFSARDVTWTKHGPWADKELVAENGRNIFIIQIGNADEFGSYEHFKDKVSRARVHINGLRLMTADFQCSYDLPSPGGGRLELHYDDDEVRYDGAPFSDDGFPRFETPYVRCGRVRWGQYHYTIAFGDHSLTHDFRELATKVEGAAVHRSVDGAERDCEEDRFWVVSHRGAQRVLPENTLEACGHAVEEEGAMALLVDACWTADGEVALWHDWSPDGADAAFRQLGAADVGAYRPVVPDVDDPLRRETIELSLAQLRFAYGYAPVAAPSDAQPAPFVIPTLAELVERARDWAALRHVIVDVRMPRHHAPRHAGAMLRRILASIDPSAAYDLTLLVRDEEMLTGLRAAAGGEGSPVAPIAFMWESGVPAVPATGADLHALGRREAALQASIVRDSAVDGAIRARCTAASVRLPPGASGLGLGDHLRFVAHAVGRLERFNLDPRENHGHQVERLLVGVIGTGWSPQLLVESGVSGIITDDVPALRSAVAEAGLL